MYFKEFPKFQYDFAYGKDTKVSVVQDITRNIRFRRDVLANVSLYDEYDIIDGETPEIIAEKVATVNMPFVTERWSGGMLTNFQTTRKSIRKMASIDKMKTDGTWETLNKRERLFKTRQREKLEKNFGSIADMTRQPAAIFLVDILKEHIALNEAKRLNIPTFAMVDTNSDPRLVDFPIPANDDATKSIAIILDAICGAIKEGLEERKNSGAGKDKEEATEEVVKDEETND